MAELAFVQDGLRHNQRERQAFLAFAIAATVGVFGLLLRGARPLSPTQSLVLIAALAIAIIAAEILTIHGTRGVISASAYIELFLEHQIPGTAFQRRQRRFDKLYADDRERRIRSFLRRDRDPQPSRARVGAAFGFSIAYCLLATSPIVAWWLGVNDHGPAGWLASVFFALIVLSLAVMLGARLPKSYWDKPRKMWDDVLAEEGDVLDRRARRLIELVDSRFPIAFDHADGPNRLPVTVAGLLAHSVSLMASIFALRSREAHNDASRLTRSLYDHVVNMAWLASEPADDHIDRWRKTDLVQRLDGDKAIREVGHHWLTDGERAAMQAQVDALPKEAPALRQRAIAADAYWQSRLDADILGGPSDLTTFKGLYTATFTANNGVVHASFIGLNRVIPDEPGPRLQVQIQAPVAYEPYGLATAIFSIGLLVAYEFLKWPDPQGLYVIYHDEIG